jgi:hypothetical protein
MMTDACEYYCDCTGCSTLSGPKPRDCCAFSLMDQAPCPRVRAGYRPTFRPI